MIPLIRDCISAPVRRGALARAMANASVSALASALAGALACSGGDAAGPTHLESPTPAPIARQETRLVAGGAHTCALSAGGTAFCWGNGSSGQLGNGSTTWQRSPVAVASGLTFTSLSAGEFSTCGMTAAGATYCWGDVASGPVPDSTPPTSGLAPTLVPSDVAFVRIASGDYHACGLGATGAAYCWGFGFSGQLGDGTLIDYRGSASPVSGKLRFASLSGGYWHTCGVTVEGIGACWGNNNWGQLGDSTRTAHTAVAPVTGEITWATLAAGGRHSCGLSTAGAAYCWGWNAFGQVGDGSTATRLSPVAVAMPNGVSFASIVSGFYHNCALTADGAAYCWGFNDHGQLGDGTTSNRAAPVLVAGGVRFASLSAGVDHTCGMTTLGAAYCWGNNADGELGDGTTADAAVPTAVRFAAPASP